MHRRTGVSMLLALLLLLSCTFAAAAERTGSAGSAKPEPADNLVQKGLTIAEIDRELGRLKREDADIGERIAQTEGKLAQQGRLAAAKREHAGRVLRAYYLGESDSIWLLLFSLRSFSDIVRTYEYLSMIVSNDHRQLNDYQAAAAELKQLGVQLADTRTKLRQSQAEYGLQRQRLVTLQEQLDQQLSGNAEAQAVMQRISEVNNLWQTKGIPMFRSYFNALAEAMKGLPELAAAKTPDGKSRLSLNGLNASFQLTDEDLNHFLRAKNSLFQSLAFRFTKDGVEAAGRQDDIEISLKGVYELNKEKKIIAFRVGGLSFNGYSLPDTTVRDLERQVDLSFNPKRYMAFLEPTGVKHEEGKLVVTFKLNF